jgi:two-component system sensor histidine kinase PilS (NtrC family)
MPDRLDGASWFGPAESLMPDDEERRAGSRAGFLRLWRGFMAVRILTGCALLGLQFFIHAMGQPVAPWLIALHLAYIGLAAVVRVRTRPTLPVGALDLQWLLTVGVDLVFVAILQVAQFNTNMNYTALLALPVLLASVLGTVLLALGTASVATLLLLADAWWAAFGHGAESATRFLQAAITGTGFFLVAFLANQLSQRLAREEQRSAQIQRSARMQTLVNEMVIDTLDDGVLVVDTRGLARAANPSARRLLGTDPVLPPPFSLRRDPAWQELAEVALRTFEQQRSQTADVSIRGELQALTRLHVRTQLAAAPAGTESLCVVFLQDLREMEARVRTEKLAAMGRMSAAVAHEIRNPLAAIAQANALLEEDLDDGTRRRLNLMIRQNADRLGRIVDDVLDLARAPQAPALSASTLVLDAAVQAAVREWCEQARMGVRLRLDCGAQASRVHFEAEHLRRILVNLLDNATRYASEREAAIQVSTHLSADGQAVLRVWSDGKAMEAAVQRHLFEPFFSSESRSSGLGLFICRELCERHGARIGLERTRRVMPDQLIDGNEFFVAFRVAPGFDTIGA